MRALIDRMPLRIRLVVASTVLLTVGLAASGVAAATTLRGYLIQRVDDQLYQVEASYGGPGGGPGPGSFGRGPSQFLTALVDPNGNITSYRAPIGTSAIPRFTSLTDQRVDELQGRAFTAGS